ncbi:MAG: S9 family peptidase, partial [Chloroflexota bacterium]|nr:S9 family peptidase [Chloroflexota bacterium]
LYTVLRSDREADRASSQVWLSGVDGSNARQLTGAGQRNREARWSPDGQWIAFVSDRGEGGTGLYVLPAGGPGEARELTRHRDPIGQLAWSPDGASIAYTASFDPADPDEQPPPPTPRVRVTRRLDYKQDNRGYLGEQRLQVFVVDVRSSERRRVTGDADDHWYPEWSPDGRRLATRISLDNGVYSQIGLIDLAEASTRRLGPRHGTVGVWAWSPRADRLLFSGDTEPSPQTDLFVYDLADDSIRRLTTDLPCLPDAGFPTILAPSQPVWLDERTVLFHAVRAGESGHYRFDLESGQLELERATRSLSAAFSVDRAARVVVQSHASLESMSEIAVYDRQSGERSIATALNECLLESAPMATWERFEVERGGATTEAWLLKPPDFDPSRRYPLVLDVHGGPHGYYGYGFQVIQQALASHGFLVVFSNPRGSGSYGREFASSVRCDWGGEDYRDLMAVVDRVLERPYADAARTGIWGYSYGGYMTAWTIGHTDRFKAAVCGAPCFDLESMYGTSDISHAWGPYQWGGRPHEASEAFAAHSPSTFAHRATTPTLILQGEADDRCPIGQGEQMFVALKQAGCEVEFVRYPAGSHAMLRVGPPSHRADFIGRVIAWFTEHLGGPV